MTYSDVIARIIPLFGVILGWVLTSFQDRVFGAKLIIDCPDRGSIVLIPDFTFVKLRIQNIRPKVAKSCHAYIVSMSEVHGALTIGQSLINDSFQIKWAGEARGGSGRESNERNIPRGIYQYVDLVTFSKDKNEWQFDTMPEFFGSLNYTRLYKGVYRFEIVVAGDGVTSKKFIFNVFYDGDYRTVKIWPS